MDAVWGRAKLPSTARTPPGLSALSGRPKAIETIIRGIA